MTKGLDSSDAAETALSAMKGLLGHTHPEIANVTMIFSKDCLAVDALVAVKNIW
jgi:hypothetical protein